MNRGEKLLAHLKDNGVIPLFVPAACTDKLQPLDLSVNYDYKELLKSKFHDWYCARVMEQIDEKEDDSGEEAQSVIVDLKTSTLKPVHARWLIATHEEMALRTSVITAGFRKAGLMD